MTRRISITAAPVEKITVDLVGVEYLLTPPKAHIAMRLSESFSAAGADADGEGANPTQNAKAVSAGLTEWMLAAFGKRQTAAIQKRLDDPEDALDITHLSELMSKVYEDETGNPPTSPRDS